MDEAKKKFDDEQRAASITDRYWKQVKSAREAFHEELQILFPNININDKRFSVSEEAFDLFVLHMYNKVNYLQKELERLQVNYTDNCLHLRRKLSRIFFIICPFIT